ncbi:ATP-dependent helicase DinG [Bacilli bacterium]|nr:DNA polymerase III subunit epsilon [Bacilli bacterium VT-13-104]PZD88347.1 ATP-dependent helicase DinG [Bacilli bacterium]PZD90442.1 ATP-dependent helicase DinG [Bacilli bacterium]PZD92228.1 ATP-dependent helicase DinG [Bacilli bacterium]RCO07095.1 ATP-dependent helicase DinG [Bacilli bacterium]
MENRYVVIDLETTGHSPVNDDKIIEAGIVVIENDQIIETKSSFFNPNKSIPPFITNLTGINNEDVKDAPFFHDKADEIISLFKDSYLVAHNVPFDLGFLNAELRNSGKNALNNPIIDTVELSRILFPQSPSYKLSQLAEFLDIYHDDPHRALSDAYVTAKILLKLKEKLFSLPYETLDTLLKLENMFKSDLTSLLSNRLKELAFSTEEDANVEVFQGLAFKKTESIAQPSSTDIQSFGDFLDVIYEENGTLQQNMNHYEKRMGQREMSEAVFDSFQGKKHALIEAETGTGKSLAYLIPAIHNSVKSKQRIIISTYTTQLQSQLLDEDIPLLEKIVPFPFQVALLKGKSHYISLEKFAHELQHGNKDNYDIILTKAMILVWLTETETGDIDEINLPASGYLFYKNVSTESEGVLDPYSPWFSKSYYQKAKRRAQQANIIITNHALLCTDIFNDNQFLPPYKKVIIDEAHHFEETAAHHYGLKLDYITIQYTLNQIGHSHENNKLLGKVIAPYALQVENLMKQWDDILDSTKYEVEELFRTLYHYVLGMRRDMALSDIGRVQYRYEKEKEDYKTWNVITEMATRLTFYFRDLIHVISSLEQKFDQEEWLDKYDKEDLNGLKVLLQNFIDSLEILIISDIDIPQAKWIEIDTKGKNNAVYLYCEPTDISSLLAEQFFDEKESVILTSATLTMANSFSFMVERLGLSNKPYITQKITSPFSYRDQVQLLIPNDFPEINYRNMDDFILATSETILDLANITDGRMLVLFTSYDMLKKSYKILKEKMDMGQYMLIAQGITSGSRSRLKKNFQSFNQSILLGTSSFWEGVDIPGDDLSCLMIVRLPFQPPNHPVYEAKANYLKTKRKNPFMEYSLPNAVIRFKQGFGRLIRSSNDRGIVFVCDARVIKARYGKYFINSIPEVPITFDSTNELMEKAKKWF